MAPTVAVLAGLRAFRTKRASPATMSPSGGLVRQLHACRPNEVRASGSRYYSNDYIHAESMYNLTAMSGRSVKFGALVWGGVLTGILVPLCACNFQQRKPRGGA
ncbi:uncharacterized protein [Physcomitrium patens]|uniref:Uncharacterized protein n=1 Tax=Physcomitrium patens TaxID=3218 RepID=A0A7I4E434_PHYPA|nr:uncharacterized protein LOC112284549 isoform X2 [Physcomitrium patens]|eukprot:XP_024380202.1 uncharacterized protein LOC112284549 isoform X2 [Physcomitrella patens]